MRRAALQLGSQLRLGRPSLANGRAAAMSRMASATATVPRTILFNRTYAASHAPQPQSGDGHGHDSGSAHGGAKHDSNDILWLLGSLAVFLPVLTYVTEPKQSHKPDSEKPRGTSSRFKNLQAKAAAAAAAVVEPEEAEPPSHAEDAPAAEAGAAEPIEEQTAGEPEAAAEEVSDAVPASEGAEPVAETSAEPAAPAEETVVPEAEPVAAAAEEPKETPAPVVSPAEPTMSKELSFPYVIIGLVVTSLPFSVWKYG
jgi:hypothetical protein